MKIKDIVLFLENVAPLSLQESYDNSGLLVGSQDAEVDKVLISLDCTEAVVDEAIASGCSLIISHHPVIFSGLKRLNGNNYVERTVIKAVKHDIALYAIHTNLDNISAGVNAELCRQLGLHQCQVLSPKMGLLRKLYTFIPLADFELVRQTIFEAGAGQIGNYSETSFKTSGTGSFKGNKQANPSIGKIGQREEVEEAKLEVIFPAFLQRKVISALIKAHPYEEVAYDIVSVENPLSAIGAGMAGILDEPMEEVDFLNRVKQHLHSACLKHTRLLGRKITKVAVCGGSGRFLLPDAIAAGADAFVTADVKYHEFFDADGKILLIDAGHYETEQYTPNLLLGQLLENFPTFAFLLSKTVTNPVNYL